MTSLDFVDYMLGAEGNRNALKHGHYSAEAIATRGAISALLRHSRDVVKKLLCMVVCEDQP